jgi:multidrug efflux system membrane fusion protein
LITDRAIGNDQGRKFVYVVNSENVVERCDVVPGRLNNGLLVILEGLEPDDWVIGNGIQRVRDGMAVQPQRTDMPGSVRPAQSAKSFMKK